MRASTMQTADDDDVPAESSDTRSTSFSSMRASITQTADDDAPGAGSHRQPKQSSGTLPVSSPASNPSWSWVLLNGGGALLDDFPNDLIAKSATSRTSEGEEISVSFELVEPPGISVLAVAPSKTSGNVIAAHRDVVLLLAIPFHSFVDFDLFVYQASRGDPSRHRQPSLLLLPDRITCTEEIGIMYCTSYDGSPSFGIMSCTSDDGSPSFVVAELRMSDWNGNDVHLFRSESGQWESFKNLHIRGTNGGHGLRWWSTDDVVPYDYGGRRYMIWVDYYRGMVIMDLSSKLGCKTTTKPPKPPKLWYVPLPVDRVREPKDKHGRREWPKARRSVSVTRYGIKFVSIDTQHFSNYGVGHRDVLKWSRRFRVTTWSLREDYNSWKKDLTVHEEEFWDAFDGGDRFPLPHVQPEFPVVDMDNPDVVVFRLQKPVVVFRLQKPVVVHHNSDEPKWMIEVDLRKKILLAATSYTKESDGLSGDAKAINSVRLYSGHIPSELPRYMDGGQA